MAQEVGVRSIADLKKFGSDLKMLSEQLSNAFSAAERKMHAVCDGWNDQNNLKFMQDFTQSSRNIFKIAEQMAEYSKYITQSCDILEMYQHNRLK